jgi:hypothetical protein
MSRRERATASEPRERSGAWGPRERACWGVRRGEAPRMKNERRVRGVEVVT